MASFERGVLVGLVCFFTACGPSELLAEGESPHAKLFTHGGGDVLIALSFPRALHVGRNELVVTAQVDQATKDDSPADDLSFELTTQMPTMGHGASGNENPTRREDGSYRGTAVFSMSGDWVLQLDVSSHGEPLGTLALPYAL